jgi:DNA-binding GntR family transcriptional regulator
VFSPTRQEIEELCDFRFLLERQALQTACLHSRAALVAALGRVVAAMRAAEPTEAERTLDSQYHQLFITYCGNRYLSDAYGLIGHRVEALRHRFMHTTEFRHKGLAEHVEMLELIRAGRVSRAVAVLDEHIARTRRFQANTTWSPGRARRRDYKFREHDGLFRAGADSAGPLNGAPLARSRQGEGVGGPQANRQ